MGGATADVASRVAAVRARIADAASRAGRRADEIVLVAAAKTRTAAEAAAVVAAGVTDLGHNYVQEAAAMRAEVTAPATWRLIGPLQRNKANQALRTFDTIDSVHHAALANALAQRAERAGRRVEVLLQVRLGDEDTKSGAAPEELEELLRTVQLLPALHCLGFMTIPPPAGIDQARRWFAELRGLAERLRERSGLPLPILSMGMSHDFEAAIAEGATHIRLGTALFGPRPAAGQEGGD